MIRILLIAAVALAAIPAQADFHYSETHVLFHFPGSSWALTIPREDWRVTEERRRPDGNLYYYSVEGNRGLQLSVYLDRTAECNSAPSCLRAWRAQHLTSKVSAQVLDEGERNGFSLLVYNKPFEAVGGSRSMAQLNVSAHAVHEGHWIDIRVSAVASNEPDPSPLLAVIDNVAFAALSLGGSRRYPVGAGFLDVDVPADWREELVPRRVTTIKLTPKTGKGFTVLVSATPYPGDSAAKRGERARLNVQRSAELALSRTSERSIEPVAIGGEGVQGHYFTATIQSPGRGGYRHLAQGEMVAGTAVVAFTILSHDGEERAVQAALEMIRNIRAQ